MLLVKSYKYQRKKTELSTKDFTYSGPSYEINFPFQYGKHLLIMHLKQKLKVSF